MLRLSPVIALALVGFLETRSYAAASGEGPTFKVAIGDPETVLAQLDAVENKRRFDGAWVNKDNTRLAVAYRDDNMQPNGSMEIAALTAEQIGLDNTWKPIHAIARDGNLGLFEIPDTCVDDEQFIGIIAALTAAAINGDGTVIGCDTGNCRIGLAYKPDTETAIVAMDLESGKFGALTDYNPDGVTVESKAYAYDKTDAALVAAAKYVEDGESGLGKLGIGKFDKAALLAYANGEDADWKTAGAFGIGKGEVITDLAYASERLIATIRREDSQYRLQAFVVHDDEVIGLNTLTLALATDIAVDTDKGAELEAGDKDGVQAMPDDTDTVVDIGHVGFKGFTVGGNLGFVLGNNTFGMAAPDKVPGWSDFVSSQVPRKAIAAPALS